MDDTDDSPPPMCIPLWVEQTQALLIRWEIDISELLPLHGTPGRHRQRITLAIRDLAHQVEQLSKLGE